MTRVRTGYFARGEHLPAELDPRYDVIVVPWRTLWDADATATVEGYQDAGIAVHVHTPFCYTNPAHTTPVHLQIQAVLGAHDGWLLGADGQRVGDTFKFIDPRSATVRSNLLTVHMGVLDDAGWVPDGLFLDFLWDSVSWMDEFRAWTPERRAALDEEYRSALCRLATGLTFRLRRAGYATTLYGNGWHRCTVLDGTVLENFPLTKQEDGRRDLDIALNGHYGQATWERFREPPMILPTGGENVAYGIPRYRVVEAVAFAASYCPGAIVFDNDGTVFDAIRDLR
jgi:hypothetical protein